MKIKISFFTNLKTLCFFAILQSGLSQFSHANWDNWRGPLYNGSTDSNQALPTSFDKSKGVKWVVELPGSSAATPIVVDDRIFITSISLPKNGSRKGRESCLLCVTVRLVVSFCGRAMQVVVTDQGIPMVLITCFMIDQIMPALLQSLEGNWYFTFLEMVISSPMILMEIRNGNAIFKKIMEIFAFNGLFQRPLLSTKENFTYQSYREMNLFMGAASKEPSRSCFA